MQTRLSAFCDKLIETGWLTTVIVIPLYFNIYSQSIFEIDKTCLLRSIALLMSLGWVISAVEKQKSKRKQEAGIDLTQQVANFLTKPLVLPALMLVGVYLLTSLTSIWPRVSFFGSYVRLQGTCTTLSYVAIFFLIVQTLSRQEQVERLITLIVLTSLPTSLYAIIQHYGLDPTPWSQNIAERVTSSLGNAISVSAFLIMIVPLTLRQLIVASSKKRASSQMLSIRLRMLSIRLIPVALYLLILFAQLSAIVFTKSRGPFMGLAGGLFFFFLLLAISKNRRDLGLMVINLVIVLGLLLTVFNLPNTPLVALKESPYLARLSTIGKGLTLEARPMLWQGAINLSLSNPIRAFIGSGPETLLVAYQPYILPELVDVEGSETSPDRCHNATLDALVTTGLIGMIIYLLLFSSTLYYGLKWLNLITSSRQRNLFIALSIIGVLLGLWVPWYLDRSLRFAGVGIPAGILAALVIYLMAHLFRTRREKAERDGAPILLIALFSAIIAHFVESQSGIPITVTRTYFWVYAALLTVVGLSIQGERVLAPPATRPAPTTRGGNRRMRIKDIRRKKRRTAARDGREFHGESLFRGPLLSHSLLIGQLLLTVGFSLFTIRVDFIFVVILLIVWLLAGAVVITNTTRPDRGERVAALVSYVIGSLALCLLLPLHLANRPTSGGDVARIVIIHYLCFGLSVVAIAMSLLRGVSLPRRLWHKAGWLYAGLIVAVMLLIVTTNLNIARANVYFRAGKDMSAYKNWDASIALYKRASELVPGQAHYSLELGKVYLQKAAADAGQRTFWIREAQGSLERARELAPLSSKPYVYLGGLNRYQAKVAVDDPEKASESLKTALDYYQQAISLSPVIEAYRLKKYVISVHLSLANAYRDTGQIEEAIEEVKAASALAPAERKAELEAFIAKLKDQEQ